MSLDIPHIAGICCCGEIPSVTIFPAGKIRFMLIEVFCHFSFNVLGSECGVADLLKSGSRVVLESYSNDSQNKTVLIANFVLRTLV
jgi:hypothetical protein